MRILVLSDSHGDSISLRMAIDSNPQAETIVFLGDGADDWAIAGASVTGKRLVAVRGNCDGFLCASPLKAVVEIGGERVYCTHGHHEKVKYGLEILKNEARTQNAKIALFGHTHNAYTEYDNGLYLLNPGSVRQNSCGIVDIVDNGIMCYTKKIAGMY